MLGGIQFTSANRTTASSSRIRGDNEALHGTRTASRSHDPTAAISYGSPSNYGTLRQSLSLWCRWQGRITKGCAPFVAKNPVRVSMPYQKYAKVFKTTFDIHGSSIHR